MCYNTHMNYVIDTEWSDLEGTELHCIVVIDEKDEVSVFEFPFDDFKKWYFENPDAKFIGHNLIGFDIPALCRHFDWFRVARHRIVDTLVISKLVNNNIEGGHSLDAWAQRLRLPVQKTQIADFTVYTPELRDRCIGDCRINKRVYERFRRYLEMPAFEEAVVTEHDTAWLCQELHEVGFAFDYEAAQELYSAVSSRLADLDDALVEAFPPKSVLKTVLRPRWKADGTLYAADARRLEGAGVQLDDVEDREYEIYVDKPFNPGSSKDIIERLNEAGWKPTDKTKGHITALKSRAPRERKDYFAEYGWKLSDENLKTLPETAPAAAQRLVERLLLASRVSMLNQWLTAAQPNNGHLPRIHGRFFHIGAWTHRMSHSNPNMANIPKAKPKRDPTPLEVLADQINNQCRALWTVDPGRRLIGVDADGIQMRVFAHYVNDRRLIESILSGDKSNGTDIHSLHQRALGSVCQSRDIAKTFIYAWLLGAGIGKVAEIFGCSIAEARQAVDYFLEFYPGLRWLKETKIPEDARRGYFTGLDGRLVMCDSEHLMLSGYLQNGEAVIMKRAAVEATRGLRKQKVDARLVNFVHDEFQIETEDDDEVANYVQRIYMEAIEHQGTLLNLNLPLGAEGIQGYSWKDTH